jgi:hypothetical protein
MLSFLKQIAQLALELLGAEQADMRGQSRETRPTAAVALDRAAHCVRH